MGDEPLAGRLMDSTLAAIMAEIEEAAARQGAAAARLRAYLASRDGAPSPEAWPAMADDPDLISVAAAAERSRQSAGTIRRWCRDDEIGRKYGNEWLVSCARLAARLDT